MSFLHRTFACGLAAFTLTVSAALIHAQVAAPPPPTAPALVTPAPEITQLRLQSLVEQIIREAGLSATVGVYVQDADGKPAADVNATRPMIPASNNKLVTTAAGLTELGPDFRFETKFYARGTVENGTLNGDLVIYGGGDPGIGGRYLPDPKDITAIFRQWAVQLKGAGIKSINGNIVADDSYFDDVYFHPGWYPKERAEWYEAEISALSFNDNCVDISWSAKGLLPGQAANYTLSPKTDYVNFTSEVVVAATGKSTERYYHRGATDNNIKATGDLNTETTKVDSAAIHDGALYTVTVLQDVLKAEGIQVSGRPAKERGAVQKLNQTNHLFTHQSVPLLQVCQTINLNSQNFYTECLAKALAKEKAGEGSWTAAEKLIEEFCKKNGIYSEGHNAADGSGLSDKNNVTCKQLVSVLEFMDKGSLKEQWRSTLPQGQKRGSLRIRFKNVPEAERIFGKTGSIGGVRSLAGFVIDAAGREVYYAIMLNDLPNKEVSKGMELIDKIAVELAKSR